MGCRLQSSHTRKRFKMNTATRAANGLWSVACLAVMFGLVGLFIYWVCIQQPPQLATERYAPAHHVVSAGSIVYFEAPLVPVEGFSEMTFRGHLLRGGKVQYTLAPPDSVPRDVIKDKPETILTAAPAYPLYALFVPSYVRPGHYEYQVLVTYRLNPFKTRTVELPPITITVE